MATKQTNTSEESQKLHLEVVKQMLTLATSGFGFVAALAWNEVINETINTFIKPYLPIGSGVISLLIYATLVTTLAVFATLNLAKMQKRLEKQEEEKASKKK